MGAPRDSMSEFADAYIEAALWSSCDDNDKPLDSGEYELADETRAAMLADCRKFYEANEALIDSDNVVSSCGVARQAGHDFWLTRCGHGAGFWDGDWLEPAATQLTDAAKAFGNVDLYVGEDGKVYA